jgi:hypothetical protein
VEDAENPHADDMEGTKTRPDRTLVVILSVIAVLVVASVAAVLSRGEPALLDESTPEGVVQRYASAVIDGDEATAATYLTEQALTRCEPYPFQDDAERRVTLRSTEVFGDTADVDVAITMSYGVGPFGMDEYRTDATFDLVLVDGVWKIDSMPWELVIRCEEVNP